MKKAFGIICLICILFSCNTQKPLIQSTSNNSTEILLQIGLNETFKIGESVTIEIKNISTESITLYNPTKTYIEKKEGNKWKKIRILYCPCDAPCNEPPEEYEIPPQKLRKLEWNQKESWCSKKTKGETIRKTVESEVDEGFYRIRIDFKLKNDKKRKRIYKEFTIVPLYP